MRNDDRQQAILKARAWWADDPLFLDTETTGLDDCAEVCDLAIVDRRGDVLLDTLVRPTVDIPRQASLVHGITAEIVAGAPAFTALLPQLHALLAGRTVVVYNADYDVRMLRQSAHVHRLSLNPAGAAQSREGEGLRGAGVRWRCAMKLYAQFYGDWNNYRGNYRWVKLHQAAGQCRLVIPEDASAELSTS